MGYDFNGFVNYFKIKVRVRGVGGFENEFGKIGGMFWKREFSKSMEREFKFNINKIYRIKGIIFLDNELKISFLEIFCKIRVS